MRWRRNKVPDAAAPTQDTWIVEGAEVVHTRLGTGTIAQIGDYKGVPTLWVDFDAGARRTLEIEYALPHLRPRRPQDATTPANPKERCDYCGGRPVVITVTGSDKARRCCNTHRADLVKERVRRGRCNAGPNADYAFVNDLWEFLHPWRISTRSGF